MKLLGIDFAPLDIPLERRLQTLGVLFYTSIFFMLGNGSLILFAYLLLFTRYYYLPIAYFLWTWIDRKTPKRGGRRFAWIRQWATWRWCRDYFPIRLIKTSELDPNKNYICGYHPHGIVSFGALTCFCTDALNFSEVYPGMTPYTLTLDVQFKFPLTRDFLLSSGSCSVSEESIQWLLTQEDTGNFVVIVVGGAKEALNAHSGIAKLTLKNRKGFVRLALKNGASVVPIFSFGENEIYKQVPNPEDSKLRKIQNAVEKLIGVSPPLFFGRGVYQYTFGFLPQRKLIDVIVGKPIDVEKIENPTEDDVNQLHKKYIQELQALYDKHKANYEPYKNTNIQLV